MLIGRPHLPSVQRESGSGSRRRRLRVTQPTEMTYGAMRATVPRGRRALKATVLPMFIMDMTTVKPQVNMMLFTGMCQVSWTWEVELVSVCGLCRSGGWEQEMETYMTEPLGKGEAVFTCKRECLSRGRCHGADGDHDEEQKDHHCHAGRAAHS